MLLTMLKKITIPSVVLNVVLLLIAIYTIHSKGGIPFLINFISAKVTVAESENGFNAYYNTKLSTFEAQGNKDIIFLGDSLTDNNEWAESFESSIANRGIGGDTTAGVLFRLKEVTNREPEKIFLMIGINDLVNGIPKEKIIDNYSLIIERIRKETPETKLYVQSVLPINKKLSYYKVKNTDIESINKKLAKISKTNNASYVDLYPLFVDSTGELNKTWTIDGVHLNGDAYKVWEAHIQVYLD